VTVETLAKLINLTIVGEIAVVSAVLVRVYPFPYLKRWAVAYGLSFAALSTDALAELTWEAAPVRLVELLLLAFSAQEFFFCARLVSGPAPAALWGIAPVGFVLALALTLAGQPFQVTAAPILLLLSGGYLCVARAVWSNARDHGGHQVPWLALPFALLGLFPLFYPLLAPTSQGWLGYCFSGAGHQAVGAAMGLFAYRRGVEAAQQAQLDLDRVRDQFVAGVSHELRSPVAALRGAVDLLALGAAEPGTKEFDELLAVLQRNLRQLHGVVDGLCDMASTLGPPGELRLGPVDVGELVEAIVARCETIARLRNVDLGFFDRPGPTRVLASSEHLTSALRVLALAAISCSAERTTLCFSIHASGSWVEVTLGGTPPQASRFRNSAPPPGLSDGGGAAGIALGFCAQLLAQQGGALRIERGGQGIRLTARLPAAG
jgi:signal transduction histidine kinase